MDGWLDGLMDGWMDECHWCIQVPNDFCEWLNGWMVRWMDGWMDE